MTDRVDCIVVGAGVVGLAIARDLAMSGREVVVVERADAIGTETSSRNSEVIHAGIYYPKDSLKARFCVQGKHMLYAYCDSHHVPYRRCGKLIVAADEDETDILQEITVKARNNGVPDLEQLTADQAQALEPELACAGALLSPSTGIIDSHALMLSYQGEAEDHGAMVAFLSQVVGGRIGNDGFNLQVDMADGRYELACRELVNTAGLGAVELANKLENGPMEMIPPAYLCKGSYYALVGKQPFSRLIYPVPASASLGVHVTVDMGGQTKFGPDQEWVDELDYDVDPRRADAFYAAVRRYWPGLQDGQLHPAYAGMRPKINAPDEPAADFMIQGPSDHGTRGLVHLFGVESPGLTSSLAIAEYVRELLDS